VAKTVAVIQYEPGPVFPQPHPLFTGAGFQQGQPGRFFMLREASVKNGYQTIGRNWLTFKAKRFINAG
jgi:hypothetical protein